MKRMLLTAVMSAMFAGVAPGMALAHSAKSHRRVHHASRHVRHAARVKVLSFSAHGTATLPSGATPTAPVPGPPASGDAPLPGEAAGTVTSFTGGVLTITLKDGTVVSGKVTEDTRIECRTATPPAGPGDDEEGESSEQDGSSSGRGDSESGDHGAGQEGSTVSAHDSSVGDGGEEDESGSEDGASSCSSTSLVPGAAIGEAELRVGGSGAVWDRVTLL